MTGAMTGPAWVGWALVLVSTSLAGYGVLRLTRPARTWRPARDVEAARLLMAVGMAAMLLPVPDPVPWWGWAAAFTVDAGWLGWYLLNPAHRSDACRGHRAHHLVCALTMVYMAVVMRFPLVPAQPMPGMTGHAAGASAMSMGLLAVDLVVAIYFMASAARSALALAPGPTGAVTAGTGETRPVMLGQLVMSLVMVYALFAMLI